MPAHPPRLILASASPRRQSLLREAGYIFTVHPSEYDEDSAQREGLAPADLALHLAVAKGRVVSHQFPNDVVLAADTVVAVGNHTIGKPADADHARRMLAQLSGTSHEVITAVAVMRAVSDHFAAATVISGVRMHRLTSGQIEEYVASGQWRGKAGGYGIQDNDPFVERLSGCLTNIVGLPMTTTGRLLREAGVQK